MIRMVSEAILLRSICDLTTVSILLMQVLFNVH